VDVFAPSSKYLYPLFQILPPQPKHKNCAFWCIDLSNQALLINSQPWLLVDITNPCIYYPCLSLAANNFELCIVGLSKALITLVDMEQYLSVKNEADSIMNILQKLFKVPYSKC